MRELFFDIETIPGPTPPTREEVAANVPGNFKKPETIEAWIDENQEGQWRGESLLSHRGRIISMAWAVGDDPVKVRVVGLGPCDSEQTLLELVYMDIANELHAHPMLWIGFNIRQFDLHWLRHRAIKFDMHRLAQRIPWQRFDKSAFDIREYWNPNYNAKGTIDDVARFLGMEGKTPGMDGSKVFDLWKAGRLYEIGSYNRDDVELTRAIYRKIQPAIGA